MAPSTNQHVVIIGNGVAGITAARHIRKKSDAIITVISAETKHFFSRTALMYIYMGHMSFEDTKPYEDWFWEKNRINLVQAYVEKVQPNENKISLSTGKEMQYDSLIIATGSRFNKFGWPGQDLEGVNGLVSMQDLEYLETYTRGIDKAVVVGGGLIGIELAEMLMSRHIKVTFLVRESNYWDNVLPAEEAKMVSSHMRQHHIDLRLNTELKEIVGDSNGRVKSIITSKGDEIPCAFVGLTAGVHPNVAFLKGSGIEIDRGVLVDEYLRTNIPNVYALGDCAQLRVPPPGRKPIEAVWYVGKMMGETVASTITGTDRKYNPGIWFNSAKFLDIEYQVYGDINPADTGDRGDTGVTPVTPDTSVRSLYWEHPDGKKSIRINYDAETKAVVGFNLMGIRFRHEVCEKWLAEKRSLQHVVEHLAAANFDPEFFSKHEKEVVAVYNKQFPNATVKLKSRSKLKQLIFG